MNSGLPGRRKPKWIAPSTTHGRLPPTEHPALAAAALVLAAVELFFAVRYRSYRESSLPLVIGAIAAAVLAGLSLLFPRFGADMAFTNIGSGHRWGYRRYGIPLSKWVEYVREIREQPLRYSFAAFCGFTAASAVLFIVYLVRLF